MSDKVSEYTQTILEAYPDLAIRTARLHNQNDGLFNDIFIVNDEVIFRFPRYAEETQRLKNEVGLLNQMQDILPLPIPNPIYAQFNYVVPSQTFMGYRMLPGIPVWRETLASLDDLPLQRFAEQMAEFLIALHHIPVESLGPDLPVYDHLEEWVVMYTEFQEHLYPFMRPDAREAISRHFDSYLNDPKLHTFKPALRHGDFGTGNILFDSENKTLCGVIDFGFAGIGDPAIDIAAISTLEKRLFAHFQQTYANIEPLLKRAAFYKGTYALQEALHGIKNGDTEAFQRGIAKYKYK